MFYRFHIIKIPLRISCQDLFTFTMRSSACKYILDKVSKFEKKYAKPIQKFNKNNDEFSSSKDSSSSEHLVNNIKFIKSNATSHSQVSEGHKERLKESDPLESKARHDLDRPTLSKSFQDTCEINKKGRVHVMQENNPTGSPDASAKCEYDDLKEIDKMFLGDNNESLLTSKRDFNHPFEDVSQSTGFQFVEDASVSADHSLKNDLKSGEKKVNSNGPKTSLTVDNNEKGVKKGHLHLNLNLKLDEDPDELSDISSKGIASLSLESSIGSKNVPVRIFTFEDLIGAEDLNSVSEELKGHFEEKRQLMAQTSRTVDNSVRAGMLITDDLQSNSKSDVIRETSRNSSVERLEKLVTNVDEPSIEEEIEEVIGSSDNDKIDDASEQIHSSSETKTKENKNTFKSDFSESRVENMLRVNQYNDNHSSDEYIPDFVEDDNKYISLEKNKSNVSHKENSGSQIIKYKPKEFSATKKHSGQDLKATSDKLNRPRKKDFKYCEKSINKKKYLENEWKLSKKSKNVLRGEAHNAYTQTENFLAEVHGFEKRMETIMKTSLTSMAEVKSLPLEVSNIHSEHIPHEASAPSPLEQGFNCALKQQVELTKHFICAEYNMYAVCMAAIKEMSSSYKPATLHSNRKMMSGPSSKKASS